MPELEIQPFSDDHLEPAAELLSERHRRHRETEPLLPELSDPLAAVEADWRADDASGVFASRDGEPVGYLIAAPTAVAGRSWMRVWIAGQAIRGDREAMRDLYAAAAQRWVDEGHTRHAVFAPSHDAELVDAWFRLSFGASAIFAIRETGTEEGFDGGVTIRPGTPDDFPDAARLEIAMSESMVPAPSFSGIVTQSHDEVLAEWREDGDIDDYEFFVAERNGRIVGHTLLYHRPPDLRVPERSIDLAQATTEPEARGTGVGRAMTAHVLSWAHEHGHPVMTTDWRMTNLYASRFWPRRGFRPTFLRLYRSIP
jgi:GNAT superfamily N-acetyltransferase